MTTTSTVDLAYITRKYHHQDEELNCEEKEEEEGREDEGGEGPVHPRMHHRHHYQPKFPGRGGHFHPRSSFVRPLHFAMTLGTWEGRAVTFVLVSVFLSVDAYRTFKGESNNLEP
ncbi:hypothetical protein C8R42DRAFT_772988 [Lentinula raphanica]|nr:hypothetical protein C8R42DRAFT_772988 [Lentinula raphanica]